MHLLQRDAQIAKLDAAIEAVGAGRGSVLHVEGVAGIGKSSLLLVAAQHATAAGARVLRARSSELEHEFAWGIVRQLFEPLLATADTASRERWFEGAAAASRTLFDSTTADDDATPFALLHGLYWLAANIAMDQPLVLIVDDLHWSDAPSLRWIAHLGHRNADLPILVVTGTRPATASFEPELVTTLLEDDAAQVIWPAPLTPDATRALIESQVPDTTVDHSFAEACHDATGGNPLYLNAVIATLAADGVDPVDANTHHARTAAPEAVSRTVSRRLRTLGPAATAFATSLAIAGDKAEFAVIAELSELNEADARTAWDELVDSGVLDRSSVPQFAHPVIRQSVYAAITPGERAARHGAAAELLHARGASAERIAAQLLEIPPALDRARGEILLSAARDARRRGAADVSLTLFERAMGEIEVDASDRAELLVEVGRVAQRVNRLTAAQWLNDAIEAATDPQLRLTASIELVIAEFYRSQQPTAATRLAAIIDSIGSVAPQPDVDRLRALLLQITLGLPEWTDRYEQMLAPLRDLTTEGLIARSRPLACAFAYAQGRSMHTDAAETAQLAITALDDPQLLVEHESGASHSAAFQLIYTEHWAEAERWFDALLDIGRRDGTIFSIWIAHTMLARTYLATGRIEAALESAAAAFELIHEHGSDLSIVATHGVYAEVLLEAGRIDEAAAMVADIHIHPDTIHSMYAYAQRARIALIQGRNEDALADHDRIERLYGPLNVTSPGWFSAGPTAALAHTFLGDRDAGMALAERELERARRWGAPRALSRALRAAAHVRNDASSEALLTEAIEVSAAANVPAEEAKAHFIYGTWLRRAKRTAEARTELGRALEIAASLGMSHLESEVRNELLITGARPRRTAISGVAALTPSEARVASLARDGQTNREIAQGLFVTTKTVEVHLSAVYRKLDIKSRSQLATALETPTP